MSKVIVLGSANTDLTVKAKRLPRPHETVTDGQFMVSFGGKGANQALAAQMAGADVAFLAKIGTDAYGKQLYSHLLESGLPKEGFLLDDKAYAGVALIAVDEAGNNQILVAPGSNKHFSIRNVEEMRPILQQGSIFLTQLEVPVSTAEYALKLAKPLGLVTVLNPAPSFSLSPEIFSFIDIITPNELEAGELTKTNVTSLEEAQNAASVLHTRGCKTVIITLGSQGVLYSNASSVKHYPAFDVEALDSVAAGDAFNGALVAALANKIAFPQAIRFASAAGALSTTKRGAQESLPTKKEIEHFLTEQ